MFQTAVQQVLTRSKELEGLRIYCTLLPMPVTGVSCIISANSMQTLLDLLDKVVLVIGTWAFIL